jgi:hypothetical protein
MKAYRSAVAALATVIAIGAWAVVGAGQQPPSQQPLQLAPLGLTGQAIYPAVEGWGPTKDGSLVLLLGYFNRNKEQELDIPIGPNNRIEPGGPDMGQPTHFHAAGRQYGVFAIPVPKDFGNKRLTWTIVANGQTASVSFGLNPAYWIDFYKHGASGNEPPRIKFAESGPEMTGPPKGVAQTLYGEVWKPVELKFWAADQKATYDPEEGNPDAGRGARGRGNDAGRGDGRGAARGDDSPVAIIGTNIITRGSGATPGSGGGGGRGGNPPPADIRITWHKYRGPGDFTWDTDEIRLVNKGDPKLFLEAKTNGYFSAPGEYWLRAQVNDESGNGGGGDQCCWTTALVKVIIK